MDHDGFVELGADVGFVGGAEVVAVFVGGFDFAFGEGLFEHGVGFVVGEAGESTACGRRAFGAIRGWNEGSGSGRCLWNFGRNAGVLRFAQNDTVRR